MTTAAVWTHWSGGFDMEDILLPRERTAVDSLKKSIAKRKQGLQVFRAKPCRGAGADRSVYLYKWNGNSGWIQGQKFWENNHQERCDAAIAELKQFCKGLW
jgi:hypothetical protein